MDPMTAAAIGSGGGVVLGAAKHFLFDNPEYKRQTVRNANRGYYYGPEGRGQDPVKPNLWKSIIGGGIKGAQMGAALGAGGTAAAGGSGLGGAAMAKDIGDYGNAAATSMMSDYAPQGQWELMLRQAKQGSTF